MEATRARARRTSTTMGTVAASEAAHSSPWSNHLRFTLLVHDELADVQRLKLVKNDMISKYFSVPPPNPVLDIAEMIIANHNNNTT